MRQGQAGPGVPGIASCERVINFLNKLPAETDFSVLSQFKRIIPP